MNYTTQKCVQWSEPITDHLNSANAIMDKAEGRRIVSLVAFPSGSVINYIMILDVVKEC